MYTKKVRFLLQGPKWHHVFYAQNQICVMNQIPNDLVRLALCRYIYLITLGTYYGQLCGGDLVI
jgi:hypothetical protein